MKLSSGATAVSMFLAVSMFCAVQGVHAETTANLLRETLRQQSAAERSSCTGVQRAIVAGKDATLVVRTAVELGYNSCQVIRCSLDAQAVPGADRDAICEQVIRGAVAAGVPPDVISRCSSEVCDPAAVAALLSYILLEPNYCYFSPRPLDAPAPPPPPEPGLDRGNRLAPASPFTF